MKNKSQKGFTLIELLVVIAIISVLASLSFVGLQNARRRGNDVAALAQMNAILPEAQVCIDRGITLTLAPALGSAVCTGGANYPATLPAGWTLNGTATSDVSNGTFSYGAAATGKTITCTEGGCAKTGF